jgi:sugar phosphate isomerase/epimerase
VSENRRPARHAALEARCESPEDGPLEGGRHRGDRGPSGGRREFLRRLAPAAAGTALTAGAIGRMGSASASEPDDRGASAQPKQPQRGGYGIAYTSFAVRLQRGRDLIRGASARPALPAEAFVELCRSFGADGCQMDVAQLSSTEPAYLDGLRAKLDEAGLFVELSVGGKALFDEPGGMAAHAKLARALGATRLRVALLHGRRYEDFATLAAWREFAEHWRAALPRARRELDAHELQVGIENHKDFTSAELAELVRSVGSPYLGVCLDFGNNVAFLEDPLDTVKTLAPFAFTTHLKDMAVRPYEHGFELSEVALGTGLCPLARMVAELRAARPEAPLCLEMITRDPLRVPYRQDSYWASFGGRDAARIAAFEQGVLSRAWREPLPRLARDSFEAMQAQEDENVRRSTAFVREVLEVRGSRRSAAS